MAEGGRDVEYSRRKNTLCRYYMHGQCLYGEDCNFAHDRSKPLDMTCKYYLQGTCSYGNGCRYNHVRPGRAHDRRVNTSNRASDVKPDGPSNGRESGRWSHTSTSQSRFEGLPSPSRDSSWEKHENKKGGYQKRGKKSRVKFTQMRSSKGGDEPGATNWAEAREFVPGKKYNTRGIPSSFSAAVRSEEGACAPSTDDADYTKLCPYAEQMGSCPYMDSCPYLHGDLCDFCNKPALHPIDEVQRESHIKDCVEEHERQMKLSFAIDISKSKQCSICLDVVLEKEPISEARFGLMSHCDHCFCLSCIRTWRSSKTNEQTRSCPECRVKSDFVTPSKYWFEDAADKQRLIDEYKKALSKRPCKYFDQGRGDCYLGSKCFYKHAYPDGRIASPRPPRRRRIENSVGELQDIMFLLSDFISVREDMSDVSGEEFDLEDIFLLEDMFYDEDFSDLSSDFGDFD